MTTLPIDYNKIYRSDNLEDYPALFNSKRYNLIKTLDQTLYGFVKLAFDNKTKKRVVIKISLKLYSHGHKTIRGITVFENVLNEAKILKYLTEKQQPGVSQLVEELQDSHFHYLIVEHCGQDLLNYLLEFTNVTLKNSVKLTESQVRNYFLQIVTIVKSLHDLHIAHMDISCENLCVNSEGKIKLIDWGLACIHPKSPNLLNLANYSNEQQSNGKYFSENHTSEYESFVELVPYVNDEFACHNQDKSIISSFLCKPFITQKNYCRSVRTINSEINRSDYVVISDNADVPGKVSYMSPELYEGCQWDAWKNDIYALGPVLFTLLTSYNPYKTLQNGDKTFKLFYSGDWLQPKNFATDYFQNSCKDLSPEALNLIDKIMKPADIRPTLDQILNHPWMTTMEPINDF